MLSLVSVNTLDPELTLVLNRDICFLWGHSHPALPFLVWRGILTAKEGRSFFKTWFQVS